MFPVIIMKTVYKFTFRWGRRGEEKAKASFDKTLHDKQKKEDFITWHSSAGWGTEMQGKAA